MNQWPGRKMKKVSVIVITYNGKKHLKECLSSLENQHYKDYDVYLVDNGTDGSDLYVKELFPYVKVIKNNENYGFAKGYNEASKLLDAEYIAFLNDDTKVHPNWLGALVKEIESDKEIFAVGSKILYYSNSNIINFAGSKITILGVWADDGRGNKDDSKYNEKKYVGAVSGCSMLVRKNIFENLGGFDESYFAYVEDLDLCWRAWICGFKVVYVPESIVFHKEGESFGKGINPVKLYYMQKNRLSTVIKNLGKSNLIFKFIPIFFIYEIITVCIYIKNREIDNLRSIITGTIDVIKLRKELLLKREKIQNRRIINDGNLYKKDIVISISRGIQEFISVRFKND